MSNSPNGRHEGESLPQIDKFRELAHQLEVDEDEAAFQETVRRVVHAPPEKLKREEL